MREAWSRIEEVRSAAVERAQRMPEAALHERVNGEWSFVETLRHLLFVTDAWVRRAILSDAQAYHRLALPPDDDVDVRPWGIEVDATPSFAEVLTAREDRTAAVRKTVDELPPDGFTRTCAANPLPGSRRKPRSRSRCVSPSSPVRNGRITATPCVTLPFSNPVRRTRGRM